MSQSPTIPDHNHRKIQTIRILSHGPNMARRLGWRLAEQGFEIETCRITETFTLDSTETLEQILMIIDLGLCEPEIEISMNILFAITKRANPPRIVALIPYMDPESRPFWSELGVFLALDQTTPPPEIVASILHTRPL
ncbi:MAG: hypothetical protein DWH73_02925 [Planctomycetota bacterium]|nr:MAG: hypothetical protein DWH73_02925 [Planctomycetota bacterium]